MSGSASFSGGADEIRANGIILDDDGVGSNVMLLASPGPEFEGLEASQLIPIMIDLSRPLPSEQTFGVTAAGLTAVEGSDFELVTDSITFATGQTSAVVWVKLFGDAKEEGTETFSLQFESEVGSLLNGTIPAVTVSIVDGGVSAVTPDVNVDEDETVDVEDSQPVDGTNGNDNLIGTAEGDMLRGKVGNDTLSGAAGDDTLIGGAGSDRILGGSGNDRLSGGSGADNLNAGAGDDLLKGGGGGDKLIAGQGADVLIGGGSSDTLIGGGGSDTLSGGRGHDILKSGSGNDILRGGAGNDKLLGNGGQDSLLGDTGTDILSGGGGRDYLDGGKDDDILTGGSKADTFAMDIARGGNDTITDMKGADTLVFYEKGDVLESSTAEGFVDAFATVTEDGVLFDFGNSTLLLEGVETLEELYDNVSFDYDL
ncbi:calcium-binding protein [Donghicola sp. C2-DW-16]|uniref:Calcium-binding protein n=1 Tax=Donghicola mangrovi TaxID=2729614 RepID=A0ABX2PLI8_9RHOB|nr:calcium-binding protein [Donghicola mangrovi]